MRNNKEMFPTDVVAFRKAIYDQLKLAHPDGSYIPSTAALKAAAFLAIKELLESEDGWTPLHAVNVWTSVMLTNESAFHKMMVRDVEQGTLTGIKVVQGAKAVAKGYFE